MSDAHAARGWGASHGLAVSGVVLSALSFAHVLYTASEEPFFDFRWSELGLIAGLGAILCALFALWAVRCMRGYSQSPRTAPATVLVSLSVLWTAINLFYLGTSIFGYADDLTNPRLDPFRKPRTSQQAP